MNIRDEILDSVIREIVGPCPNRHYLDDETGEEILLASIHGSPKSRYGAGMLYPQNEINNENDNDNNSNINKEIENIFNEFNGKNNNINKENNLLVKSFKEKIDFKCPFSSSIIKDYFIWKKNKNLFILRVSTEYEFELGNDWGLFPAINYDFKKEYSTWAINLGISKRL